MLKNDTAKPATAEWATLIVFAPKKYRLRQICIDYQKLNTVAVRDVYPLFHMNECVYSFSEASFLSTLGVKFGYYQIDIYKHYREETRFTRHHGPY